VNRIAYPLSRNQIERVIGAARVVLAASSLVAVWLDPTETARHATSVYSLHVLYLAYALLLGGALALRPVGSKVPILSHALDLLFVSILQFLTLGPVSPFFLFFLFSLFCGALRWGWQGTLATSAVALIAYIGMGASMIQRSGPAEFPVDRFVVRTMYLIVSGALLVYLGRYEARLRAEIEHLAEWPTALRGELSAMVGQIAEHAAHLIGAERILTVWEVDEEPTVYMSSCSGSSCSLTKHRLDDLKPYVAPELEQATFICRDSGNDRTMMLVSKGRDTPAQVPTSLLHWELRRRLDGPGISSAPFNVGRVHGRVFFSDLATSATEIIPLTEVVARAIGASLDQIHVTRHLQDVAAGEERIRVARDLHDGVLQSLTGIRLELRAVAGLEGIVGELRDRLFATERALAIEQRELRLFIAGLEPQAGTQTQTQAPLAARLQALGERIALEWKAPVTIRVTPDSAVVPARLEHAVPLMVHEAVVNALKHGQPSRVAVTVDGSGDQLRIVVTDDGRGFGFQGRIDHDALIEKNTGPRSLINRVMALGGQMSIESSAAGARVEMLLGMTT